MQRPVVVIVEHHSTRDEVLRKLRQSFGDIRAEIAPYVSSVSEDWTESGVSVRLVALAQPIAGAIEVEDRVVRIEVTLPALLGLFAEVIASRVRRGATLLLEPPKA